MRNQCFAFAVAAALAATTPAVDAGAATLAARCAAAKRKAVGRAAKSSATCDAKAVSRGTGVDLLCTTRVDALLAKAWTRAERRGGCATPGDEPAIDGRLADHDATLRTLLGVTGPASKCTSGKFRDCGRLGLCLLLCSAKAAKAGGAFDVRCTSRCSGKLPLGFAHDESRDDCRTRGDLAIVDSTVGAFVDCVTSLLGPNGATPCAEASTTTTTTGSPGTTTSTTSLHVTTSTTSLHSTTTTSSSSPPVTSSTTTTSTTSTTVQSLTQCCVPSSVGGAFTCVVESATDCATDAGLDLGVGSCSPDPCPTTTSTSCSTSTSTSSSTSSSSTSTSTTTTTSTTTITLLACGGLYPACLGSCPPGQICTGAMALDPCTCVTAPTSSSTTSSTTTSTTLLACGGVYPACLGSCPVGQTCTGSLLSPCTCQ